MRVCMLGRRLLLVDFYRCCERVLTSALSLG